MARFKFAFAISYAAEDKSVAENLAALLANYGAKVYFAPLFQTKLLGRRMSTEFGRVFGPLTRFFVPILSWHYSAKPYPQYEWEIALDERGRRKTEFILPLRLDDTPHVGLPADTVYIDLRTMTVESAARRLLAKLPRTRKLWPKDWVATLGLVVSDLMESGLLPASAPQDYISLCDWLTDDLLDHLKDQGLVDLVFLEDERSGETLSVRVGFSWPDKSKPLALQPRPWWDILEILPRRQVYR